MQSDTMVISTPQTEEYRTASLEAVMVKQPTGTATLKSSKQDLIILKKKMNTLPCIWGGLLLQLHYCFWKTANEFMSSMLRAPKN